VAAPQREWATFSDPTEDGRTWFVDVTFLTSSYHCIWGEGCKGILLEEAPELAHGCCSFGAHFCIEEDDDEDLRRVEKAAARLGPDDWQFWSVGQNKGITARTGHDLRTRVVDGACIFLNRPGFSGGAGCALHRGAVSEGEQPLEWKPDVCWQVPVRVTHPDPDGTQLSFLTEYGRDAWGDGGEDFAWWCTEASEAFSARNPLFVTMADELAKLLGSDALYDAVAAHCRKRIADGDHVVHPAQR